MAEVTDSVVSWETMVTLLHQVWRSFVMVEFFSGPVLSCPDELFLGSTIMHLLQFTWTSRDYCLPALHSIRMHLSARLWQDNLLWNYCLFCSCSQMCIFLREETIKLLFSILCLLFGDGVRGWVLACGLCANTQIEQDRNGLFVCAEQELRFSEIWKFGACPA